MAFDAISELFNIDGGLATAIYTAASGTLTFTGITGIDYRR